MVIWKIVLTINTHSTVTTQQNGFKSILKYWLLPQVRWGHVFRVTGLLSSLGEVFQQIKATETTFSNLSCSVFLLELHISNAPALLVFHRITDSLTWGKPSKINESSTKSSIESNPLQTNPQPNLHELLQLFKCWLCQQWPRSLEHWQRWWQ